jgi:adenine deaminase
MRAVVLFVVLGLVFALSPAFAADAPDTFISGATVIDVRTGRTQVSDILIHDGRIAAVRAKGARKPTN